MASSSRTRTEQAGFTLLEVEAAVIILSLLVVGVMKLVWHHEELAAAADEWVQGEPTYYVEISSDPYERILGKPGELVESAPPPLIDPPPGGLYSVTVLSWNQTLYPPVQTASVVLTLL